MVSCSFARSIRAKIIDVRKRERTSSTGKEESQRATHQEEVRRPVSRVLRPLPLRILQRFSHLLELKYRDILLLTSFFILLLGTTAVLRPRCENRVVPIP